MKFEILENILNQSPVGFIVLFSITKTDVREGALVLCITPFGTVKPCFGFNSIIFSSKSINSNPSITKKNSSSFSCLCQ